MRSCYASVSDHYNLHGGHAYHIQRRGLPRGAAEGYITDLINQRTVSYIHQQKQRPFFIYVPYNAVHHSYQVPDDPSQYYTNLNKNDGTRAGYAKMVERIDQGIGDIFAALEQEGVLDNTLIIFSSDNGGERFSDNRPLFNHKTTLWEGGIRVPPPIWVH